MPIYKNETSNTVGVVDIGGCMQMLAPGEQMETYGNYPGLTKIADTPMFNPVIASDATISGTSGDVTLNSATIKVRVYSDKFNPVITMFRGSTDNTPGEPIYPGTFVELDVHKFSVIGKLYFTMASITAGTLIITEYKNEPHN